jgi:predicted esterase
MPRYFLTALTLLFSVISQTSAQEGRWWDDAVEAALVKSKSNRTELESALQKTPETQRSGMSFLIANMPDSDLTQLKARFLLENTELAYQARAAVPWGKKIPEELFLNDVLPYANLDEKRDDWRKSFMEQWLPLVKNCKTPGEAAQLLNSEIFKKLQVRYSTDRRAACQSPQESISQGKASCSGLSIILSDACRAVCIPARLVGTPLWANKRGNHTWVEIWDKDWHFTGAAEYDPKGLDRSWFIADAAQAQKDSFQHAIYASSFRKTQIHFPMVWNMRNKEIPAINVTDRYTQIKTNTTSVRVHVRVVNAEKKRVSVPVTVLEVQTPDVKLVGKSRDESADTNDFLSFQLRPNTEYLIKIADDEKKIKTAEAGSEILLDLTQHISALAVKAEPNVSAKALQELQAALEKKVPLSELASRDFSKAPLSKSDAASARDLLWKAHSEMIRKDRAEEIKNRVLKEGTLEMPFAFKTFGSKPANGRSLWISMHGGGGAPKQVNDQQWENQKRLYTLEEGIYLAPRAPTNTWNLWHEAHIDRLFTRLIEDLIVLEDVNPDRVYILGYSAGGDGVYQLAPRMADQLAGAAMMAGHPNGVSLLSVRNLPFALQVGGNDSAFKRNQVGKEYGEQLAKYREADPKGYENYVKIHENKGHWMNLEDKAALPWMAKFTRNTLPDRVVWKQTGIPHDRFYWLAVPADQMKADTLLTVNRDGQKFDIKAAEKLTKVIIRLDDRLADLDKPVQVTRDGKPIYSGTPSRTIAVMLKTLLGRGDPKLVFNSEITVELP